jgi:hypothetical protein
MAINTAIITRARMTIQSGWETVIMALAAIPIG